MTTINLIRKKSILFTLALASTFFSQAQEVHKFSVADAVNYALKNSVAVKNALADIKIQEQVNREITAAAYPQVNGSIGVQHFPSVATQTFPNFIAAATYGVLAAHGVKDGNGNAIVPPADFGTVQAQFGTKWNASVGAQVQQLLFDGQVFVGLQARNASMRMVRALKEVTEDQIVANVQKIYYQLVVGKRQMTSLDANIERFEKLLSDTKEIFKNGFAERLDVDKVTVHLNNLRTEKIKVQSQLDAGNAGLKFLMNMPQKDVLQLTDTLSEERLKANLLDESYNYTDRKEYKLLSVIQEMNRFNIKRYKLSYIPTVALFGNYSVNAQRNKFNFFNNDPWFRTAVVGMNVSVPIFDGFAKRSRINRAKLELEKTTNNLEQLKQSIDYDIAQSRIKITSALVTVDNQKRNMELAEKVYNTTKLKYEQGLGSNQEIYNAQTELRVAQNNYYSALYDAIMARVEYLKAAGKLTAASY